MGCNPELVRWVKAEVVAMELRRVEAARMEARARRREVRREARRVLRVAKDARREARARRREEESLQAAFDAIFED